VTSICFTCCRADVTIESNRFPSPAVTYCSKLQTVTSICFTCCRVDVTIESNRFPPPVVTSCLLQAKARDFYFFCCMLQCSKSHYNTTAVLLSGNNFQKIQLLAKFLRMLIFSCTTFHKIQRLYLIPAIDDFWIQHQQDTIQEFQGKDVIVLGM